MLVNCGLLWFTLKVNHASWRSAAIVLISCPDLLPECILIMASNPAALPPHKPSTDLFSPVSSRPPPPPSSSVTFPVIISWLPTKVLVKKKSLSWSCPRFAYYRFLRGFSMNTQHSNETVVELGPLSHLNFECWYSRTVVRFCDFRQCRSCSSSLLNFIAPPMVNTWSPCYINAY